MIFPGSLTALRYELQASASVSREIAIWELFSSQRWPACCRGHVGQSGRAPFCSDLPFDEGCHPLLYFVPRYPRVRDFEISREFWNGNERWREKLGRVGLCFRSFGRFRSGISESTVELRSMKFFFLSISEFSSWAFVIWRG